jgi:glycosyltransferase involved in cell wall biosynthesis
LTWRQTSNPRQRCAVLLPVRNGGDILTGWFDAIECVADFIVALDDGSTDDTLAILESHPLVQRVLVNPVREKYAGWDDWANRQRLVLAASRIGAEWFLFVDADERFTAEDAVALRRLIDTDAQAGFAYGFERFRVSSDSGLVDPRGLWVYRLFAAADAGAPLRAGRLHAMPVPSSIPPARWLPTSIRLRHLGEVDDRQSRIEKYREADPNDTWRGVYDQILDVPSRLVPWSEQAPGVPLLLGHSGRYADDPGRPGAAVAMTAVLVTRDDQASIDATIEALMSQRFDEPFEVIVVGTGTDDTVERAGRYPGVRCFRPPGKVPLAEARNIGLWAAAGEYVVFPGSPCRLAPDVLATRVRVHDTGWGMVGGVNANGDSTSGRWVSYFVDHLPNGSAVSALDGPDGAGPSYVTEELRSLGGFPVETLVGDETADAPVARTALTVAKPADPGRPIDGPLLAVGGWGGNDPLAGGTAAQLCQRLRTLTRYAYHKGPVRPALAPVVTAATVTAEGDGVNVLHRLRESVDDYLRAARRVGADLVVQVQPGRAALDWIVDWWKDVLSEPDVGLLVDLRPHVCFADQLSELAGIVGNPVLRGRCYVRVDYGEYIPDLPDGVYRAEFLDLRRPGTPLPHTRIFHSHVVYQ